ncbi:MAG: molecular chaperone HtpG [Acholeplasmataceae bacterium]
MARTRTFKTESKKLLHLMTHSVYTQQEIFLRELISNASDAIDRRHFLSLTDERVSADTYEIRLIPDEEKRTLTIRDNGIGFTEDELIDNLGKIAQSGSKAFLEKVEENVDIIGQFGVGFYSAFMVSKRVVLETRSPFSDTGYRWSSKGEASYTIEPIDRDEVGTTITLYLKDDDQETEQDYGKYLKAYTLRSLVKKYSDYIRYPIRMKETETKDGKETEVDRTLNQMIPIWKRPKKEIKESEMNDFYKHQFGDFEDPQRVIHTHVDGLLSYTALLFIPKRPPADFFSERYEKGLQLYSKGVFIQDKNKDLIPDHYKFIKGLVDSPDVSLNISREMLQQNRELKRIAQHVEKKITSELKSMLEKEREQYVTFYDAYKTALKYGIYNQYGMNKDQLQDLIMFKTIKHDDYITFKEYLDEKPEEQKAIYYATGKTRESIENLPQMDVMKDKGYDVLLLTEDVDEFMIHMIGNYQDIPFKSVQQGESDVVDEAKKKEIESQTESHKDVLEDIKKALGDRVKDVKLSARLKDSPVCLVAGEGVSLEMEKVLKQMPNQDGPKADKILEINPDHAIFKALKDVHRNNRDSIGRYANVLYHQALLIEGFPIDDPTAFSKDLVELMIDASHKE